jgi:uncharacterized protein YjbI with pentapeptide repeats
LTLAATLPGLAALVALMFNWVSVSQTRTELHIAEQAQITTRFNVAVTHLGSSSQDVRFGGIYALERIMQDSPRDQPRIIAVLSAFVRSHARVPADGFPKLKGEKELPPDPDVTAVTEVLAERPPEHDGRTKINWKNADLRGLGLHTRRQDKEFGGDPSAPSHLPFAFAHLSGADLREAVFKGVNLHGAEAYEANLAGVDFWDVNLSYAFLYSADLTEAALEGVNLRGAVLWDATLVDAQLYGTDLTDADLSDATLTGAHLTGGLPDPDSDRIVPTNLTRANLVQANLTDADLGPDEEVDAPPANLTHAVLSGANLTGADLTGVNLTGADLGANEEFDAPPSNLTRVNLAGANLTRADLSGANLTGANLTGANLKGANLKGANLKGASTDEAVGFPPPSSPG